MCMYCERRKDVKYGWEQPKLPYHNQEDIPANLTSNVLKMKNGMVQFTITKRHVLN